MCALCGVLGGTHWADAATNTAVFTGAARHTRRGERLHRARLVSAALAPAGLSLQDWQGARFVVRSRTGRQEVVDDLMAVWAAAEKIRGRPIDPLDLGFLAAIEDAAE
jgi:hypothetical protein